MLLPQPRGDQIHLGLRRRHGHARLQRADHVVVLAVAASRRGRRQRQRQIDIAVLGDAERGQHLTRQREARLQDADDPARFAVQRDRRADDARIQSIPPRPCAVAEHGGARRARRVFFWCEKAPNRGLRAEHREQIRRRANHANPLWIAAPGQRVVAADRNRDLLEPAVAVLDVEVLRRGKPVLGDVEARRSLPQNDEAVGVLVRQRPQQQRARHAEQGRVGADADGERQHRRQREAGLRHEPANRVPDVLQHVLYHSPINSQLPNSPIHPL